MSTAAGTSGCFSRTATQLPLALLLPVAPPLPQPLPLAASTTRCRQVPQTAVAMAVVEFLVLGLVLAASALWWWIGRPSTSRRTEAGGPGRRPALPSAPAPFAASSSRRTRTRKHVTANRGAAGVYHESQRLLLCGLHALNTLLQEEEAFSQAQLVRRVRICSRGLAQQSLSAWRQAGAATWPPHKAMARAMSVRRRRAGWHCAGADAI